MQPMDNNNSSVKTKIVFSVRSELMKTQMKTAGSHVPNSQQRSCSHTLDKTYYSYSQSRWVD